jgi:antitoxin CptB
MLARLCQERVAVVISPPFYAARSPLNMSDDYAEFNRVYWASRRGMLELDLVLMPYAKERYPQSSLADRAAYQLLLESEDTELFDWFLQKDVPDSAVLVDIVAKVLDFARTRPL